MKVSNVVAKKRASTNGRTNLEEALALLLHNQAEFVSQLRESDRAHLRFERETSERFARIEAQMAEIIRVLAEHGRLLERLPEAVREKIGFKGQS